MNYCFNPECHQPQNESQLDICNSCGCRLILKERFRGIRLLGKSHLALTMEVEAIDSSPENSDRYVLKILLTDYPKAIELFQQEAQILGQLDHDGIPKIATDGYFNFQLSAQERLFQGLVIRKIPGLDLLQWFEQHDNCPLTELQAKGWLKQILAILEQLHQAKYFHRDIKPSKYYFAAQW